ncbi:MAG: hypothetical protein B7Y58_11430 [Halothiobacillus sp. 35-54-62]|nr:MAG: hypothetical protein B7Y58_11430 [Halothiobacillus sp. 35-54-62]
MICSNPLNRRAWPPPWRGQASPPAPNYAQDILAALSEDKYTRLIHTEGEAIIDLSLKELETQFGDRLLRIHRHALINRARLQGVISQAQGQHFADVLGLVQPLEISRRALPLVRAALAG